MMFGTTTEHALRALTSMATLPEDTVILGRDLARSANIPANYLSKILLTLRNVGVIGATRGSGGGYKLRKRPGEIRLMEIVELFDPFHARSSCLLGSDRECSDANPCSAHMAWREVRSVYLNFLDTTTIADIATHGDVGTHKAKARSGRKRKL